MTIQDYQNMYKQTLKPETVYAGEFLESYGFKFGIDFGTTNAINRPQT